MHPADRSQHVILVAEHDAVTRELLAQVLQTGGFNVVCAPCGVEAFLMLREEQSRIGWLVSRVELPGLICGRLLADEYRMHHPTRQEILTSDKHAASEHRCAASILIPLNVAPLRVLDVLKGLAAEEADMGVPTAAPFTRAA
jgi:CheY-like chemotaxis protein